MTKSAPQEDGLTKSVLLLGFDVGGTKIELSAVRVSVYDTHCTMLGHGYVVPKSESIIWKKRISTEREKGYESILGKIEQLYQEFRTDVADDVLAVGFGLPGTIDPRTGQMLNGNTNAFVHRSLKHDFGAILPGIQHLDLVNDANAFALAETFLGVGVDYEESNSMGRHRHVSVGVILGTGCGGGLVCGGHLIEGRRGGAAEIGHTLLVSDGKPCFCGRRGCAEAYVSGTGLVESDFELTGEKRGGDQIFQAAESGDSRALEVVRTYKKNLAAFLANMTNAFDPHYFVLGGGVSLQKSIYEGLQETVTSQLFLPSGGPQIFQHRLGDSAGGIGAAIFSLRKVGTEEVFG